MFKALKQIFSREQAPLPALPAGHRVYAVGDVHGRLDLLQALAQAIETDDEQSDKAETTIILLGDLVDRGAHSAGVIDFARRWQQRRDVRILWGNHEEMFMRSFEDPKVFKHFLRHGGRETVLSYGVDADLFTEAMSEDAQQMMREAVPQADVEFINGFDNKVQLGDYLFVHAGISPGVALEEQKVRDLRWIREPFLSCDDAHGYVVIHGHTITTDPEDCGNRIGIDTGAFMSGRLTALRLEATERSFIEAFEEEPDKITTSQRAEP